VSLESGVELFNAGLYWEAHEAWEEAWVPDRHGPDRGFYKGLIQVAAGCLHYRRGNRRGALNKWRGGADLLRPYLPGHRGLHLAPLVALVDRDVADLERADPQHWPELTLPQVERLAPG
jgi:predicted metal-dependent hydrolase